VFPQCLSLDLDWPKAWPENPSPSSISLGSTSIWIGSPRQDRPQSSNCILNEGEDLRRRGNYVEIGCRHDSLRIYVYGVGI
jgi:hypothetical protein